MSDYWFFLSYAKRDAVQDPYIREFFERLARRVASAATLASNVKEKDVGFFDQDGIETGDFWRDTLTHAIQSTRTLVCLFSRSYFNSEFCGKEFGAFYARLGAPGASNQRPPLVIPVLWDKPDFLPKLPEVTADIQFRHAALGAAYAERGLSMLIRLSRYKDDYEEFVENLANKIVQVAQAHTLERLRDFPPLDKAENAFRPKQPACEQARPRAQDDDEDSFLGPGVAKFFYASAQGPFWQPYLPDDSEQVGIISNRAAVETKLLPQNLRIGDDLITRLRRAEETNTVVVIVVDPWSVSAYMQPLQALDGMTFINCGILIPFSAQQGVEGQEPNAVQDAVRRVFSRAFILNSNYIKDSISSAQQLQGELIRAIAEVRRRIQLRQTVFRPLSPADHPSDVATLPKIVNSVANA